MIVYVDIDGTICHLTDSANYEKAEPIQKNINKINGLYDEGHTVVYWTARGTVTQVDWLDRTKKQLLQWGVKSHDVRVGKPYYDLFIDDKNMNTQNWK